MSLIGIVSYRSLAVALLCGAMSLSAQAASPITLSNSGFENASSPPPSSFNYSMQSAPVGWIEDDAELGSSVPSHTDNREAGIIMLEAKSLPGGPGNSYAGYIAVRDAVGPQYGMPSGEGLHAGFYQVLDGLLPNSIYEVNFRLGNLDHMRHLYMSWGLPPNPALTDPDHLFSVQAFVSEGTDYMNPYSGSTAYNRALNTVTEGTWDPLMQSFIFETGSEVPEQMNLVFRLQRQGGVNGGSDFISFALFDDVSISPVPEPSTLMLVAMGVLAVGGAAYRRRRTASAA